MKKNFLIIFYIFLIFNNLYSETSDSTKTKSFFRATYNWYKNVFNTYDTCFVQKPTQRFAVQIHSDNYLDFLQLKQNKTDNSLQMSLQSEMCSNIGISLTVRPFTISYYTSATFSKSSINKARLRFTNSRLLFNFEYFNDPGEYTITKIAAENLPELSPNRKFNGYKYQNANVEIAYIFNNKRYAQSAAYTFSSIQKQSAGSWISGIAYTWQQVNMDFSKMPTDLMIYIPEYYNDMNLEVQTHDFCATIGYGYNFVIKKNLTVNATLLPRFGLKRIIIHDTLSDYSFSINPSVNLGVAYNYNRFVCGIRAYYNSYFSIYNSRHLNNSILNAKISIGYRF